MGGVHIDMIRNFVGQWSYVPSGGIGVYLNAAVPQNAVSIVQGTGGLLQQTRSNAGEYYYQLDPSRMVPTGAANKPRGWGALACCYLGQPT